jgi:glycerol-3-phosphate acyltransferase PlsY
MGQTFLIFLLAYLAGSINFAIIFFKLTGKGDPRLSYSGNAGTTNVYRQAGILWATVVFLLDIGRSVAVALAAIYFLRLSLIPWAGFFLVLGNTFPCFHGFRGGKGVANYLGFTLLIAPWAAFAAAIIWLIVYGIVRVPFIASFFMIFTLTIGHAHTFNWHLIAVTGAVATLILVLLNHRKNIDDYRKKAIGCLKEYSVYFLLCSLSLNSLDVKLYSCVP